MSDSILTGDLGAEIGEAMLDAGLWEDVIVTVATPGGGPPHDPEPPTLTDHPCKGFVDSFTDQYLASGLVQTGDVKVNIIGVTLDVEPTPGDTVTVRGREYEIIAVSGDPAGALDELHARSA